MNMDKILDFPTQAKIEELEKDLAEVHAKIETLEQKMKLSCRSGISLKDDTKEGLFGLLAQSMAIADEIGRLRGFDEEKWLEEYYEVIDRREQNFRKMFYEELAAVPEDVDEKRLYFYGLMERELLQTKAVLENGESYELVDEEWDKFSFFYEQIMEDDAPIFQELGDGDLPGYAEVERLEETSLYDLCEEMLEIFSEKEEKLASADKGRYVGEIFIYYRAMLHAISDKRLR